MPTRIVFLALTLCAGLALGGCFFDSNCGDFGPIDGPYMGESQDTHGASTTFPHAAVPAAGRSLVVDDARGTVTIRYTRAGQQVVETWRITRRGY